jgi:predicted pyridoxine 5'-phosphate oxidase superfamily flavin-nucleotide-binding protein
MPTARGLNEITSDFIRRSPFIVLATADREGNQDASPKGDHPGFVAIEDSRTLRTSLFDALGIFSNDKRSNRCARSR